MNSSVSATAAFLTIEELSQHLPLSIKTIRRRIRDGSIPAIQPGGKGTKILIPLEWLNQQSAVSQESPPQQTSISGSTQRKIISGSSPQWMKQLPASPKL